MARDFISYKKSIEILNNIDIKLNNVIDIFISDALGYTLAQDIKASENSPAFPTSSMDGYAVQYKDISVGQLEIIDINPAGGIIQSKIKKETCIKTFTGALMPDGSDTLIPIENVTVDGDYIIINQTVPKGFSVREIGENYKKNEILVQSGTQIDFAHIGIIASLNISHVKVYQKPTISIASTGSEILDLGEPKTNNSQIRSSNHLTLEAIAKKYGAIVNQKGVIKDDKISILNLISDALQYSDIVVTTGGVSVGDYDFVKDIIKDELNATVLFQGVNIKPGQHIIVAQKENKFIIGLPGFAYSSTVTFILYVLPIIFKFKGANETLNIKEAVLKHDITKHHNKTSFNACDIEYKDGNYLVSTESKKNGSSAILTNMLGQIALMVQDEQSSSLSKGEKVTVILP